MSRSHSYSHDSGHSRGSRRRGSSILAVTEASFQGLQLNETAGTHHTPSYTASDPTYPRSLSSHRGELTASYLQPGYDTGNFTPAPPSETFVDPQRVFGDYKSSDAQRLDFLDPETVGLGIQQASVGSSVFHSRNMSTYSYPTDPTSSHYQAQSSYSVSRSSSMQNSPYSGGEPPRRSMSSVTGLLTLPSSTLSGLSTQERVIARQRRRGLQEPRREAKVRLRRAILPSTSDAGSSRAHTGSHSTDFLAAPSSASSYDVNASSGPLPYGGRASSATSTRGQYVSCSPNPYEAGSYQAGYSMPNVSQSLHPPSYTPVVPSSMPDRYGLSRRPSSTSVGPPHPNEPIRIVEQPSRPQCWDHGCNGRPFSTFSNLLRHQREKSGTATKSTCPRCGAEFTRTTARNGHMQHEKCKPRSG